MLCFQIESVARQEGELIAYLEGILSEKKPVSAIIDVNGVGYSTFIPVSTYNSLPEVGSKIRLLTHTYVREDAFVLYGFASSEEKETFELLLGVNGIGPKSALAVLSSVQIDEFQRCILEEDLIVLTKISGIGKKTAQRLVMELKEKLQKIAVFPHVPSKSGHSPEIYKQALSALLSLGYDRSEAKSALQKVFSGTKKLSAEELVKEALSSNVSVKLIPRSL